MANEKQFRRTSAGDAEVVSAKAGLSVPERKVLAKLTESQDAASLAQSAALTYPGVSVALARLEKLGLVESSGGTKVARDGLSASARYSPTSGSGLKIIVGALIAAGIGFGGWKAMSPSKKTEVVAEATAPATPAPAISALPAIPSDVPPPAVPAPSMAVAALPPLAKAAESTATKNEKLLKEAEAAAAAKKAAALKAPEPTPIKLVAPAVSPASATGPAAATAVAPPVAVAPPAPTAAPTPAPTAAPAPTPAPTPAPAPTAAPTPAPTPAPTRAAAPVGPPKLLTREEPVFPRSAKSRGISRGNVLAKLFIDGAGNVTNVEIVRAEPPRAFDTEVIRALSSWKYERSGRDSTAQVELNFIAE